MHASSGSATRSSCRVKKYEGVLQSAETLGALRQPLRYVEKPMRRSARTAAGAEAQMAVEDMF